MTKTGTVWGIGLWLGGMVLIVAFGTTRLYPALAIPAAVLTAPLMAVIARVHLRAVPATVRPNAGLAFGAGVLVAQFVLDALGWLAIFRFNLPALPLPAREATAVALPVAYFWMLVVPWWMGNRPAGGRHG